MIAYTIEAALSSELFDQVLVSTDSEVIAATARKCGAEAPFLRDTKLADDHTPVSAVTVDALNRVDPDGSRYDYVAQLMPNCPLRNAEDVRNSYEAFARGRAASQISISRYGWQSPWWAMQLSESHHLEPVFEHLVTERSQDLPDLFCPTGAIWWATAEVLRRGGTFHIPGRSGWEIAWQHATDIDSEEDFSLAEMLMRSSLRKAIAHVF